MTQWVKTADRRPDREDASFAGQVLAVKNGTVVVVKWSYCTPRAYTLWTRFPEPPKEAPKFTGTGLTEEE